MHTVRGLLSTPELTLHFLWKEFCHDWGFCLLSWLVLVEDACCGTVLEMERAFVSFGFLVLVCFFMYVKSSLSELWSCLFFDTGVEISALLLKKFQMSSANQIVNNPPGTSSIPSKEDARKKDKDIGHYFLCVYYKAQLVFLHYLLNSFASDEWKCLFLTSIDQVTFSRVMSVSRCILTILSNERWVHNAPKR